MAKVIPVLDPNGFVTDLIIKVDQAMSNFYITQRSQTDSFRGQLVSLSDLVRRFGDNTRKLQEETTQLLQSYFDRQFDEATLNVKAVDTPGSGIDLQIYAILRDGNNEVNIAHSVSATNSRIKAIIDLQNDGKEIINADLFN